MVDVLFTVLTAATKSSPPREAGLQSLDDTISQDIAYSRQADSFCVSGQVAGHFPNSIRDRHQVRAGRGRTIYQRATQRNEMKRS